MGLSKKYSKIVALSSAILMTATTVSGLGTTMTADAVSEYNYAKGLQYSMYLYDANMCGTEVGKTSAMDWRDNCHTNDTTAKSPNGSTVDVSGGYHDAGDHVKFGLPQAYSASVLGWGYYEFKDAYTQTGQDGHMKTISTYFADYFKKCTVMENGKVTAFCYQVGDGNTDHAEWCSPESQNIDRPTYWATSSNPATDIVANTVGALAFHSKNFGDSEALTYAKALYEFAKSNNKQCATDGVSGFYSSDSYVDDLMWAAASLYTVTGDKSYLSDASTFLTESGNAYVFCSDWPLCWGNMWPAVNIIFGQSGGVSGPYGDLKTDMQKQVKTTIENFQNKNKAEGVFSCQDNWGSARYNAAMQLVALVFDKYNGTNNYGEWAKSQMDYILGNNKNNICYITGLGDNSAKQPHHRAATGYSNFPSENVGVPYAHTLIGALVGGPDSSGNYVDDVDQYTYTEVAIDYNAGLVGAMAGLYRLYGSGQSVDSSIVGVNGTSSNPSGGDTTSTTTTTVTTTDSSSSSSDGKDLITSTEIEQNSDGTNTVKIHINTGDSDTVTLNMSNGVFGATTSGEVGYWDSSANDWIGKYDSWENQKFDINNNINMTLKVPKNTNDVQILFTYYADWSSGSENLLDKSSVNFKVTDNSSSSGTVTTTTPKVTTVTTSKTTKNTTVTTTSTASSGGSNVLKNTEVKNNSDGSSTLIIYVDTDSSSTVDLALKGLSGYTTSGQVGYWDNNAQKWVDDIFSWENQKFDNSGNLTVSNIKVPTNQKDVQIMITYYADWSSGSEVKGDMSTIQVVGVTSKSGSSSGSTTSKTTVTTTGGSSSSGGESIVSGTIGLDTNTDGTDTLKIYLKPTSAGKVTLTLTGGKPGATTSGEVGYWDSEKGEWIGANGTYFNWSEKKFDSNGNLTIEDIKVPVNQKDVQILLTYYADWSSGSEKLLDKTTLGVSVTDGSTTSNTTVTTTTKTTSSTTSKTTTKTTTMLTTTGGSGNVSMLGDANCDGNIRVNDIQAIRRQILHIEDLTSQGNANADVNGDGRVAVNDIQLIRRYILHLDSVLGG